MGTPLLAGLALAAVMNDGGVPYTISNPRGAYSTDFEHNVPGKVEHFDVYGTVRTSYSEVYWTRNAPIPLPPALVERFKGKVMAITGYEIDQVTSPHAPANATKAPLSGFACMPDCGDGDVSVPIYNAYNHHYFSWIHGAGAEVVDLDEPTHFPNPTRTGIREHTPDPKGYPTSIVFKENPGGEYRKSYHGYPAGFAQLVASPTTWIIDTHNRNFGLTEEAGYHQWHLPKQTSNSSITEIKGANAHFSPLLECPCTDRVTRVTRRSSLVLADASTCAVKDQEAITSAAACAKAIGEMAEVVHSSTSHEPTQPAGCLVLPGPRPGTAVALYNAIDSKRTCEPADSGDGRALPLRGIASVGLADGDAVKLSLSHDGVDHANITLAGPADAWFGVGLIAHSMADTPYAIIIDGAGEVSERRLTDHGPGVALNASVKVLSSKVAEGVRTVILSRQLKGATSEHTDLPTTPGDLAFIAAVGQGPKLAYHKAHGSGTLSLLPSRDRACVCAPTARTYLAYMNRTTSFSGYSCKDEPRSDMLRRGDGTGRSLPNLACDAATYGGGLQCCHHTYLLTDMEQEKLIRKEAVDTYFLKWRYYFQEYVPPTATQKMALPLPKEESSGGGVASHRALHHWVFLIDAQVNDYEEDNAHFGSPSIGKIEAHLTAAHLCDAGCDTGSPQTLKRRITPYVITPHCHAPSCIREELWDADKGVILCNVTAQYGDSRHGPLTAAFNEANYVAIPPCLFGHEPGLLPPITLDPSANLTAVKYFNNTYRHLGQMAQWTGLATYEGDPF